MYVILVNEDDTMTTTKRERIMQRSKLFNSLWFLANPTYKEHDISSCTVLLEYLLPISRRYCTEILSLSNDMYMGYLKYMLPIDTNITAEHGDIELQLTFIYSDLDEYGNSVQLVRKTMPTTITVTPISAWSDIIPDSALTSLDQRIIKMDAQIKAINEVAEAVVYSKADDIVYDSENNFLQLTSEGNPIGQKVVLNTAEPSLKDGVPVVDFGSAPSSPEEPDNDDDNVIEF